MPDALPGTTLPIYPGLGQAQNMMACIHGGFTNDYSTMSNPPHFIHTFTTAKTAHPISMNSNKYIRNATK